MRTLANVLETIAKDTVLTIKVNGNVVVTGYRNHIANDITLQLFLNKLFKVRKDGSVVVLELIDYKALATDRVNILQDTFAGATIERVDFKTIKMTYNGQTVNFDLHTSKHDFLNQVRNIQLVVE